MIIIVNDCFTLLELLLQIRHLFQGLLMLSLHLVHSISGITRFLLHELERLCPLIEQLLLLNGDSVLQFYLGLGRLEFRLKSSNNIISLLSHQVSDLTNTCNERKYLVDLFRGLFQALFKASILCLVQLDSIFHFRPLLSEGSHLVFTCPGSFNRLSLHFL